MSRTLDLDRAELLAFGQAVGASRRNLLSRAAAAYRQWRHDVRSREELLSLDEYQLRDIGVTPSQVRFDSKLMFIDR